MKGRFPSNVIIDKATAKLLDEQSGESVSPAIVTQGKRSTGITKIGTDLVKQVDGYADSGGASRFFYTGKASPTERGEYNTHPTVKPVDLMQYLVKLTKTPTGGTVLDMFAGSGTTGLACQNEGRDYILIELDPHHGEIIERRLRDNYGMFCNLEIIR